MAQASNAIAETVFTRREIRVIERLVARETNPTIARTLGCALKTVEFHVRNILNKLGETSRDGVISRLTAGYGGGHEEVELLFDRERDILNAAGFDGLLPLWVRCLTPRESGVLAEVVRGRTNKEIAQALRVSHRTVEFHVAGILKKANCHSKLELLSGVVTRGRPKLSPPSSQTPRIAAVSLK